MYMLSNIFTIAWVWIGPPTSDSYESALFGESKTPSATSVIRLLTLKGRFFLMNQIMQRD